MSPDARTTAIVEAEVPEPDLRRGASAQQLLLMAGLLVGAVALGQALGLVRNGEAVPLGVVALGAALGSIHALTAAGIVLVHRATRVLNFAQTAVGLFSVSLLFCLVQLWEWPWYGAAALAIPAGGALGAALDILVFRRLLSAPRLVVTVATIAVSQLLVALALDASVGLPKLFLEPFEPLPRTPAPSALADTVWQIGPIAFTAAHLAAAGVGLAAITAVGLVLRFTRVGIGVRAMAEGEQRAAELGVPVRLLSTAVWATAGVFGGLAAVGTASLGNQALGTLTVGGAGVGAAVLLRGLVAATVARFDRLGVATVAAIAIAIAEQSIAWVFSQGGYADVVLLVVLVVALMSRRRRRVDHTRTEAAWSLVQDVRPIPPELAGLTTVRNGIRRAIVVLAAVALGLPWLLSPGQLNQASLYVIYGIVTVSLVILTGWSGHISLGQFALVAVGALVGGRLTAAGIPFPIAIALGVAAGGAFAFALAIPALRLRGLHLATVSLAFAVVMSSVVLNPRFFDWLIAERIRRPRLLFVDLESERIYYYVCLAGLVAVVVVVQSLRRTRTGRVLVALRENERTAQGFGVDALRTKISSFVISGAVAAFGGVLFAYHQHGVSPQGFQAEDSIQIFLMAVIGGLGSVPGVLFGALYLGTANILIAGETGRLLAGGLGVLAVILLAPGGIGSLFYRLRDVWLRRVAIRHRISVPGLFGTDLFGTEGKFQFAPNTLADGTPIEVPVRYRVLDTVIRETGSSQRATSGWRY